MKQGTRFAVKVEALCLKSRRFCVFPVRVLAVCTAIVLAVSGFQAMAEDVKGRGSLINPPDLLFANCSLCNVNAGGVILSRSLTDDYIRLRLPDTDCCILNCLGISPCPGNIDNTITEPNRWDNNGVTLSSSSFRCSQSCVWLVESCPGTTSTSCPGDEVVTTYGCYDGDFTVYCDLYIDSTNGGTQDCGGSCEAAPNILDGVYFFVRDPSTGLDYGGGLGYVRYATGPTLTRFFASVYQGVQTYADQPGVESCQTLIACNNAAPTPFDPTHCLRITISRVSSPSNKIIINAEDITTGQSLGSCETTEIPTGKVKVGVKGVRYIKESSIPPCGASSSLVVTAGIDQICTTVWKDTDGTDLKNYRFTSDIQNYGQSGATRFRVCLTAQGSTNDYKVQIRGKNTQPFFNSDWQDAILEASSGCYVYPLDPYFQYWQARVTGKGNGPPCFFEGRILDRVELKGIDIP